MFRDPRHPYLKALLRPCRASTWPGERLVPIREIKAAPAISERSSWRRAGLQSGAGGRSASHLDLRIR
jgi:hypothetical protein